MALLVNPTNANAEALIKASQAAASSLGIELRILRARTEADRDAAFATAAQLRAGALVIGPDTSVRSRRTNEQLAGLAAQYRIPTISWTRSFFTAGGLMSYGDTGDAYRLAGVYTGRILNGEKPSDLPVQQATKVELLINLKTAKGLGLTIPDKVLAIANEVIE
jgi:putative ABC transport system substrate-binding protein